MQMRIATKPWNNSVTPLFTPAALVVDRTCSVATMRRASGGNL
jgi:hypothetical protein